MPSRVVDGELTVNVPPSGSFTTADPSGTGQSDYSASGAHDLLVAQLRQTPFAVSFGASLVTVTNNTSNQWRVGDSFFLQLELVAATDAIDEIEGLQDALDAKANASHSHAISDTTGLQTALDGKAASSHTHSTGDISGLGTAATVNTGTGEGNVPVLDADGDIPASMLTKAPGGAGSVSVEKDDSEVVDAASTINFEGAGVSTVVDEGSGKATITIPGLVSGSGDSVRRNVNSFSGATITDKLQNAADSGEPLAMPAGVHTLDGRIDIPAGGIDLIGAGDGNRMAGATLIIGPQGDDIFRATYTGTAQARPGGQNQITMRGLGLRLRPNGANTRSSFERATTTGYGIGICGIAFIRGDWPTETTTDRSISNAWNTSHARINNITCDVEDGSAIDHGCGMFHSQGNTYGSRFHDLDSGGGQSSTRRGAHSLLTIAQPYLHRVTCDAGTDRVETSGTNQFLNNQRVIVRAHDATGTRPGGIDFDTVYHVVNRDSSGFQLSETQGGAAINITSAGSGFIYAILVGGAGAVFSPDEVYIDRISHYNGKMGVSVCNPERLWLGNLTSYAIETILEIPAMLSTASRSQAISTTIMNIYSESPQATAGNANSECVLVESDGLFIGTMQVRGADSGPQPIFRFTGNDHTIMNFDGRSSFGQGGIDFRMEATNGHITGQCHTSSTVTTQADTTGRLREASGAGYHFQRNFV